MIKKSPPEEKKSLGKNEAFEGVLAAYFQREKQREPSPTALEHWLSPSFRQRRWTSPHTAPVRGKLTAMPVVVLVGLFVVVFGTIYTLDEIVFGSLPPSSQPTSTPSAKPSKTTKRPAKNPPQKCRPHEFRQAPPIEHFRYVEEQPPSSLNPIFAENVAATRISDLLFDRLVGWDKESKPAPGLATTWKIDAHRRWIIFQLRQGVKWHDGTPFSAQDVAFTIKSMPREADKLLRRSLHSIVKSVKILDTHRIQVTFHRALHAPLEWFHFPIIPRHRFLQTRQGQTVEKRPQRDDAFARYPVGTGPYRFSRMSHFWTPKIDLLKVQNHWRSPCFHPRQITLFSGGSTKLQLFFFQKLQRLFFHLKKIHLLPAYQSKIPEGLEKSRHSRLYPYAEPGWWYIGLNHKPSSVLSNLRVREAFAYALNRKSLLSTHLGFGFVLSGPFASHLPYHNFNVLPRKQQRKKARHLLDMAGWKLDGKFRKKNHKILTVRWLQPDSQKQHERLYLQIQKDLQNIGVMVRIDWLPDEEWEQAVFKHRNFDMTIHRWSWHPLSSIFPLFHSKGKYNYISYHNPTVDALLERANAETNSKERRTLYKQLHALLHKDLPYIFLWDRYQNAILTDRISRITFQDANLFYWFGDWKHR